MRDSKGTLRKGLKPTTVIQKRLDLSLDSRVVVVMVSKGKRNTESTPVLKVQVSEAKGKLAERIELGRRIRDRTIRTTEELATARSDRDKWSRYNSDLIAKLICNSESLVSEYENSPGPYFVGSRSSLWNDVQDFKDRLDRFLTTLESISERLDLWSEEPSEQPTIISTQDKSDSRKVFIVHSIADAKRDSVARLLESLDLKPIILLEAPDKSRTIIEKFEQESDAAYAVVILTPDDECRKTNDDGFLSKRPRQNVILELGYFIGKLGRNRVCALKVEDVEIPSDIHGVLYVAMGPDDGWKLKIAKEIRAAGLEVDLNKVV